MARAPRAANESIVFGMSIPIDQRRSGYPCRSDPVCRFISSETPMRDTHELVVHGAVHVGTPIPYAYQSGFTKQGRSTLGRKAQA